MVTFRARIDCTPISARSYKSVKTNKVVSNTDACVHTCIPIHFPYRCITQCRAHPFNVDLGHPQFRNHALACNIQVEQVQRVEDGLDLLHLDCPSIKLDRNGVENAATMIKSAIQDLHTQPHDSISTR